jgi:hypothetical protein
MFHKGSVVACALAGLLTAGGCSNDKATSKGEGKVPSTAAMVKCEGVNECKGHGACKGGGHACAGKNGCKGQGFVEMSTDECAAKGGKVL